jgi:hypothetical protein
MWHLVSGDSRILVVLRPGSEGAELSPGADLERRGRHDTGRGPRRLLSSAALLRHQCPKARALALARPTRSWRTARHARLSCSPLVWKRPTIAPNIAQRDDEAANNRVRT